MIRQWRVYRQVIRVIFGKHFLNTVSLCRFILTLGILMVCGINGLRIGRAFDSTAQDSQDVRESKSESFLEVNCDLWGVFVRNVDDMLLITSAICQSLVYSVFIC